MENKYGTQEQRSNAVKRSAANKHFKKMILGSGEKQDDTIKMGGDINRHNQPPKQISGG